MSLDVSPPSATIAVNVSTTRLHQGLRWALRPQIIVLSLLILLLTAIVVPSLPDVAYARAAERAFTAAESAPTDAAKLEAAAAALQQAGRWASADPTLYRRMAQLYLRHGRSSDAIAVLEQAYRMQPESLLVSQDLAQAYEAAGETQRAGALWARIGMTPERMVRVGNTHLEQHAYPVAMAWYRLALDQDSRLRSTLAFQATIAAILSGSPDATSWLETLHLQDPTFQVFTVQDTTLINGSRLRWWSDIAKDVTYGTPLSYPLDTANEGMFWWTGQALTVIAIPQTGSYNIQLQLRHSNPPPVEVAFGIDGQQLHHISLTRGDNSWETVHFEIHLTKGWHTLHLWFLNDGIKDGKDRDAAIAWVKLVYTSGD